ncbi:DNA damage-repair/toleration protein DRT100 [Cryptomeria japonica]|uniref:DNA damage-repair/toleration protein DRT100 n=1 Tax=Cryptomeria japonica TaxID=3369 RepID=UPI0025ACF5D1|nr:DNA damage-repair/toleration protein DRT100 [Cryptomeria japonica]
MAVPLCKLCIVFISVFLVLSPSLSHRLIPNRCPYHESQALLRFKAALNDSEGYLSSWVNGTDCCTEWFGISCDNHTNHIVSVSVYFSQGVMSESLCQLRFLTSLSISGLATPGIYFFLMMVSWCIFLA